MVRHAATWHVNSSAFGACGVSYGAGIAVLAAAHDTRIKTALSLSGWGTLTVALWGDETASLYWGNLLLSSGSGDGHELPVLAQMYPHV